jgi:phosphoserine phosphatase RsbX
MSFLVEHCTRPRVGEQVNGDAVVVRRDGDAVLVAVVDALGHGPEAARVAAIAVDHIEAGPITAAVDELMDSLHQRLRNTRGAVATLLYCDRTRLVCAGVGNVDVRGTGLRVQFIPTPGILGAASRRVRCYETTLPASARIALFSDGISSRLRLENAERLALKEASTVLFAEFNRPHDDATLVLLEVSP